MKVLRTKVSSIDGEIVEMTESELIQLLKTPVTNIVGEDNCGHIVRLPHKIEIANFGQYDLEVEDHDDWV